MPVPTSGVGSVSGISASSAHQSPGENDIAIVEDSLDNNRSVSNKTPDLHAKHSSFASDTDTGIVYSVINLHVLDNNIGASEAEGSRSESEHLDRVFPPITSQNQRARSRYGEIAEFLDADWSNATGDEPKRARLSSDVAIQNKDGGKGKGKARKSHRKVEISTDSDSELSDIETNGRINSINDLLKVKKKK